MNIGVSMYSITNIYKKLSLNYNKYKTHVFIYKLFLYPLLYILSKKRRNVYKMFAQKTTKDRFTFIYKNNLWPGGESNSGFGSGIKFTRNLRLQLPKVIEKFKIKSILDAPCGDFLWMQQLLPKLPINEYIGADIVDDLIKKNNTDFANCYINFINLDVTQDKLPQADLMIMRDCSNIKYLLTTNHPNPNKISGTFANQDIITADGRMIDLFSKPFNFNKNLVLYTIDDWMAPEPERTMILLEKSAVPKCLYF